jgi:hypothetical protein
MVSSSDVPVRPEAAPGRGRACRSLSVEVQILGGTERRHQGRYEDQVDPPEAAPDTSWLTTASSPCERTRAPLCGAWTVGRDRATSSPRYPSSKRPASCRACGGRRHRPRGTPRRCRRRFQPRQGGSFAA